MSSQWGRIDEDGTVFVRTSSGERVIGSWQAGDAEAGLAYYTRRYDDLATEVTLLEQRMMSGAADPATTRTHASELAETLPTASVIGDLDSLADRLSALQLAAPLPPSPAITSMSASSTNFTEPSGRRGRSVPCRRRRGSCQT